MSTVLKIKNNEGNWIDVPAIKGDSGVYYGSNTPPAGTKVWVDTSGTSDSLPTFNTIYPIGSIYLSMVSTNPASLFGGTWERIAEGKMLIGVNVNDTDFNLSNKTGGSKAGSFTLSSNGGAQIVAGGSRIEANISTNAGSYTTNYIATLTRTNSSQVTSNSTPLMGRTDEGSIMNPYLTCYIWRRTALSA